MPIITRHTNQQLISSNLGNDSLIRRESNLSDRNHEDTNPFTNTKVKAKGIIAAGGAVVLAGVGGVATAALGPIVAAVVVGAATLGGVGLLIHHAVENFKEAKMINVLNNAITHNLEEKDLKFIKNNIKTLAKMSENNPAAAGKSVSKMYEKNPAAASNILAQMSENTPAAAGKILSNIYEMNSKAAVNILTQLYDKNPAAAGNILAKMGLQEEAYKKLSYFVDKMNAVKKYGWAFEYVEPDALPNKEAYQAVALAAVKKNGLAFQYVKPDALPNKEAYLELAQAAVLQNVWAFQYVKPDALPNKEAYQKLSYFFDKMNAVKKNGLAFQYVKPDELPNKEAYQAVALAAVKKNGLAFQYVKPDALPNKEAYLELAQAAVKEDSWAFEYVNLEQLPNKEAYQAVALAAVQQNGWVLEYVKPEALPDKEAYQAIEKVADKVTSKSKSKALIKNYINNNYKKCDNIKYFRDLDPQHQAEVFSFELTPSQVRRNMLENNPDLKNVITNISELEKLDKVKVNNSLLDYIHLDLNKERFDILKREFEGREPGYFEALKNAQTYADKTLENNELSVDILKEIHKRALQNVAKTNLDNYQDKKEGGNFTNVPVHFGLVNNSNKSTKGLRELKNSVEQGLLGNTYCEAPFDRLVSKCKNLEQDITNIISHFNDRMSVESLSKTEKLLNICEVTQLLERRHAFKDGNCRTICMVLLNSLLNKYDFPQALQANPNKFDGYSLFEMADEMIYSMYKVVKLNELPSEKQFDFLNKVANLDYNNNRNNALMGKTGDTKNIDDIFNSINSIK